MNSLHKDSSVWNPSKAASAPQRWYAEVVLYMGYSFRKDGVQYTFDNLTRVTSHLELKSLGIISASYVRTPARSELTLPGVASRDYMVDSLIAWFQEGWVGRIPLYERSHSYLHSLLILTPNSLRTDLDQVENLAWADCADSFANESWSAIACLNGSRMRETEMPRSRVNLRPRWITEC